jgi:hypothetical protein
MIDYNKLKLAYELADKLAKKELYSVEIDTRLFSLDDQKPIFYLSLRTSLSMEFKTIDLLIAKLEELTKLKPKFNVDDFLWIINDSDPYQIRIKRRVDTCDYKNYQCSEGNWYSEHELFKTKQELIESQIKHWMELKKECDCEWPIIVDNCPNHRIQL